MFGEDESVETELYVMEDIDITSQQPSSSKVQILASSANPEPEVLKTPASAEGMKVFFIFWSVLNVELFSEKWQLSNAMKKRNKPS